MVVDTSEEIAGGGDIPHACIGGARRMLGTVHQTKYEVLEEAVANHGPEVSKSSGQHRCRPCNDSISACMMLKADVNAFYASASIAGTC